ncbi:MAG: SDR family NAD(P)-dependent oxidoreductase [Acidobacteriales bacterium]|nr:SDR family NAD(P)-dependent oxidoreductase [Terriglobales bacterium]
MPTLDARKISIAAISVGGAIAGAAFIRTLFQKPKPLSIAGKVVVITGGSRGLGLQLATEFGKAGSRLVLAARDQAELERAPVFLLEQGAISDVSEVLLVPCDLKEAAECEKLIRQATERFGRVDVLINNAGTIHVGPIEKQPLAAYRDAMESNFFSALQTTQAVLPQMLQRREGAIVNITSIGGKIPVPHLAPYVASKFAAVGFSETLHAELRSKGIRVTTVCPGLMRTGSYPNAIVVGELEKEYRWFSLSASLPGLAHSSEAAARTIFQAVVEGRTEITIGVDAYLAARFAGLAPDATQLLGHVANSVILPKPKGTTTPTSAQKIKPIPFRPWQLFSNWLTRTQNEPSA